MNEATLARNSDSRVLFQLYRSFQEIHTLRQVGAGVCIDVIGGAVPTAAAVGVALFIFAELQGQRHENKSRNKETYHSQIFRHDKLSILIIIFF